MGYNLSGPPVGSGQDLYTALPTATATSALPHTLGEELFGRGGTAYRYCRAGAAALVVGNVIQSAAEIADHQALVPVAAAIGDTTITVALGATAATENQYAGGTATVTVTPGLGQVFRISGHPAAALSTSVVLTLSDSVRVALTTSSRIDLAPNPYSGVIQAPATTLTGVPVGVCTTIPIGIGEYGWIQTKGPAAVLTSGTLGPGLVVGVPAGTNGAVTANPANVAGFNELGAMMETSASGETNAVLLNMP